MAFAFAAVCIAIIASVCVLYAWVNGGCNRLFRPKDDEEKD